MTGLAEAQTPDLFGQSSRAVFSPDKVYRYDLTRHWGTGLACVTWVMLNPSTADHEQDDPTLRRITAFSKAWGYDGLAVCNLFALRATDPVAMRRHPAPIGPDNDRVLQARVAAAPVVVAAWGVHGTWRDRASEVLRLLGDAQLHCLGTTANGQPKHPLYVRADQQLVPYQRPSGNGR